jgi:opacity protein-like surface antigen
VREPPRQRSVEAIYQQRDALFEQRFSLEPSITYTRFDRRLINLSGFLALDVIFLGNINVQQTKSDLITLDLTGRWGVTDRLQLDLNVPYLYRHAQFLAGGAGGAAGTQSEATVSKGGVGDASAGVHYQLVREGAGRPDLILIGRLKAPTGDQPYGIKVLQPDPNNTNLNVPQRLPTGSGVWTTSLGVSVLKTTDPAILFGNLGWIHSVPRRFADISTQDGIVAPGRVDLRNAITWGAGAAFALNERMSMSFGFSQLISQAARTKVDGGSWSKIIGSNANAATFNVGVTYGLGRRTTAVLNFGIGLTPDAPDFSVTLRLPFGI